MPSTHHVSQEDIQWIDDAIGYDNAASVGAAYSRLVSLRQKIEVGCDLKISTETPCELRTTGDFDVWVRDRYPVFTDDQLHPLFRI